MSHDSRTSKSDQISFCNAGFLCAFALRPFSIVMSYRSHTKIPLFARLESAELGQNQRYCRLCGALVFVLEWDPSRIALRVRRAVSPHLPEKERPRRLSDSVLLSSGGVLQYWPDHVQNFSSPQVGYESLRYCIDDRAKFSFGFVSAAFELALPRSHYSYVTRPF